MVRVRVKYYRTQGGVVEEAGRQTTDGGVKSLLLGNDIRL